MMEISLRLHTDSLRCIPDSPSCPFNPRAGTIVRLTSAEKKSSNRFPFVSDTFPIAQARCKCARLANAPQDRYSVEGGAVVREVPDLQHVTCTTDAEAPL